MQEDYYDCERYYDTVEEVVRGYELLDRATMTMKLLKLRYLPVVDHCRIVGILTDDSPGEESVARKVDPTRTQVRNVMMAGDMTCSENLTIKEMTLLLKKLHKSFLVVLDSHGQAVGIVSQENISRSSPNR